MLVQTGIGTGHGAVAETESETLTEVLSKWESLSEDLRELEGETGVLVKELLCHVPVSLSDTSTKVMMTPSSREEEAMTLESITLADVKAEVGSLESKVLQETRDALENKADILAKEEKTEVKMEREEVVDYKDAIEAELYSLDSISEATDALEAETSVILESMFGSEQGLKHPPNALLADEKQDDGSVVEAMSLESVTLAEVEASLRALENESLNETSAYLEEEAESLSEAGVLSKEKKMEVKTEREDVVDFKDAIETELYALDSISDTTDALEAKTSVILESIIGLKQPHDASLTDKKQDEAIVQEVEKESRERDGSVVEAMSLESVTLAEVEASLIALEGEYLKETSTYLEEEAEILAGEKKLEVAASKGITEGLKLESLSEADVLSKEKKMEVKTEREDVVDFKDAIEAELYSLHSISDTTDALEAQTSVILESIIGLKQPTDASLTDKRQDEAIVQEVVEEPRDKSVVEAMSLESVTLAEVEASLGALEGEYLKETSTYLEEEATILAGEKKVDGAASKGITESLMVESEKKMEVKTEREDVVDFKEAIEAELYSLDSISDTTDALEAQTSVILESIIGLKQPPDASLTDKKQDEAIVQEVVEEPRDKSVVEAMSLESVTLAEVEASLGALEGEYLKETSTYLEEEAEILAGGKKVDGVASKGITEGLTVESEKKMEVKTGREDFVDFKDAIEAELYALDSISEATDALEAQTSVILESIIGLKQPPDALLTDKKRDQAMVQEVVEEPRDGSVVEAMSLESVTLAELEASMRALESESLKEVEDQAVYEETTEGLTVESLSLREAAVLKKEGKMEVGTKREDVVGFEDVIETEIWTLDSISEATDALEAETSVILESMFGSEQGLKQPSDASLADKKQDEVIIQEVERESKKLDGSVMEAMSLESVTLAEIEASLRALESESLNETSAYLEEGAEILAGEKKADIEDITAPEEMTETLTTESLSLPEADSFPEALQTDALMQELLFSVPGNVALLRGSQTAQEVERENILDATVAMRSEGEGAQKEVLLGQEEEEDGAKPEHLEIQEAIGTHADLDPVQRLFLEKIREYNNMRRLSGEPIEKEPDYEKSLSEETAKLQRLYGGGDLDSFPQFTFTEPTLDKDSK